MIFSKFRSGVIDDLSPEVHILLQLIQGLGIILIHWQHLKLVALAMRDLRFLGYSLKVETAAYDEFSLLVGEVCW